MAARAVRLAVIGIGNLLLQDEGLGVHAVRELAEADPTDDVLYIDGGTDPWLALQRARGCSSLLLVDAVLGGRAPGACYSFGMDEVEPTEAVLSLHGVTLYHLIQYEKLLGNGFDEVRLVGMEPFAVDPGIGLSARCRERLPELIELARREIRGALERCALRQGGTCDAGN